MKFLVNAPDENGSLTESQLNALDGKRSLREIHLNAFHG
jgi:hypothetical protein